MPFGLFKKTNTAGLKVKKLTNYLGVLLKDTGYEQQAYDGKKLQGQLYRDAVGRYEAVLTQAAYFSRMMYEPNNVIAGGLQYVNYNPVVFNTAISLLRSGYSRIAGNSKKETTVQRLPYVGEGVVVYAKEGWHEIPCHIQLLDYSNMTSGCPFPGEKVMYVCFRGTNSFKSGLADVKAKPKKLSELFDKANMNGQKVTDLFVNELKEAEEVGSFMGINPFGAHSGFIDDVKHVINSICETVYNFKDNANRIIVTGHSLGGANATLCSLVLAACRRAGIIQQPIHCITFGAPKLFTEMSRVVYNRFLEQGHLTLDRVANRAKSALSMATVGVYMDAVPAIPPNFVHPGYMVLKTEIKTQSRTGRSKNISDIRQMFGGIESSGLFTFNEMPSYPEFLKCFTPFQDIDDKTYKYIIENLSFATLWKNDTQFLKILQSIINNVKQITGLEIIPEDKAQAEAEANAEGQKMKEEIATAEMDNEELAGDPEQSEQPGQSGGGKYTDEYKAMTVERGPNHIVYKCQTNITKLSCHMGYMSVGFYGGFKNISLGRAPYTMFKAEGDKLVVKIVILNFAKKIKDDPRPDAMFTGTTYHGRKNNIIKPSGMNGLSRPSGMNGPMRISANGTFRPSGMNDSIRPSGMNGPIRPSGMNGPIRPSGMNGPIRPSGMNGPMRISANGTFRPAIGGKKTMKRFKKKKRYTTRRR